MYMRHSLFSVCRSSADGGVMGLHSCNRLSFDFEPRWDASLPRALIIVSRSIWVAYVVLLGASCLPYKMLMRVDCRIVLPFGSFRRFWSFYLWIKICQNDWFTQERIMESLPSFLTMIANKIENGLKMTFATSSRNAPSGCRCASRCCLMTLSVTVSFL